MYDVTTRAVSGRSFSYCQGLPRGRPREATNAPNIGEVKTRVVGAALCSLPMTLHACMFLPRWRSMRGSFVLAMEKDAPYWGCCFHLKFSQSDLE